MFCIVLLSQEIENRGSKRVALEVRLRLDVAGDPVLQFLPHTIVFWSKTGRESRDPQPDCCFL